MRLPSAVVATALLVCALPAQTAYKEPSRPRLAAGADTNDAHAYFLYGMRMVDSLKASGAVAAFYWASQIDPESGDLMYNLYSARLMQMSPEDLGTYLFHSAKLHSAENLALDSLLYRAYMINPFLYRSLDRTLMPRVIEAAILHARPNSNRTQLGYEVEGSVRFSRNSPQREYADGRFIEALEVYAKALTYMGESKRLHDAFDGDIHAQRAQIFYLIGNMDSARTEMTAAVVGLRALDSTHVMLLYRSKAMYEQSLGIIQERLNNAVAAREAFEQALTEDLSHYAAHIRLAQLQIANGDSTAALTEMDLAIQLEPNDPAMHYHYANVLVRARRDADAANHLRLAIATDSLYAAPHLLLARIAEVEQYDEQAIAEYTRFTALASRTDPQYAFAKDRLSKSNSAVASSARQQ